MAFDNEKSEQLCSFQKGNRGEEIRVNKITDKNTGEFICVDIRQYFTNDSNELCPTKKGVRIQNDNHQIESLIESLSSCLK